MGGWKLEVGKMVIYMAFPVGLFHYFNQPEYFEEWVTKIKQETYPPESTKHKKMIEDAIKDWNKKKEISLLKALDEAK
ncbi:protein PET100 homolog, mitochondrial [Halyomorpha halys]|uniref:protein PET100 homolog, mitochondrial n=1 Tax=Halyomorpha halys TaxID=286706 RepID=UPI0006D4CDE7|nr:protein PET100 homolog, mitochondrial [Halyomorpha halys]XP_014271599.1 protein PET100 homolog, mitochondrial [Halyomorpha halys]XP_014271600.1 protein PET100 homolog, mitochondrial [Halyomorpha halys]XP_014271601.1 protein PET100 homolog, mitochondrial [Halyomorpha halys]